MDPQQSQLEQMATPMPTPVLKLEDSPADSLMSLPASADFTPLFPQSAAPSTTATSPPARELSVEEAMTPNSLAGFGSPAPETDLLASFSLPLVTPPPAAPTPAEKKPTKKRKSWGQVLPEPKTNLPPRKRAKTEDEKEQRRVERVLRNRRAAQSSRERKRAETEKLEQRNRELESTIAQLQRSNMFLLQTLKEVKSGGQLSISSPALETLINSPTLGRSVFPACDQPSSAPASNTHTFGDFASPIQGQEATVDPARLSPGLTPIPEDEPMPELASALPESCSKPVSDATSATADSSIDLTQHPAEVLCDLQCQSTEMSQSLMASTTQQALAWILLLSSATLTATSILTNPLSLLAFSSKAGLPLPPSPPLLNTIIWMVTRPRNSWTSSSTRTRDSTTSALRPTPSSTSSFPSRPLAAPTRSSMATPSRTLRSKSLKKILTCSPGLARPLADATLAVLRLVSEEHDDQVSRMGVGQLSLGQERHGGQGRLPVGWMSSAPLPSREALLTLLWAIKVEERRLSKSGPTVSSIPSAAVARTATSTGYALTYLNKRRCGDEDAVSSSKKQRVG